MTASKRPTLAQKKKRNTQLRDAQRRRRERLRTTKQRFVQIILPETTLATLLEMISASGETMQQVLARLIETGLGSNAVAPSSAPVAAPTQSPDQSAIVSLGEDLPEPELNDQINADQREDSSDLNAPDSPAVYPISQPGEKKRQLDLFG